MKVVEAHRRTGRVEYGAENTDVGRVNGGDSHAPSALAGDGVYHGHGLGQHRHEAVEPAVFANSGTKLLEARGGKVGVASEVGAAAAPAGDENLVDFAQARYDAVAYAEVYGIACSQGGGDDEGAEHEAYDDENGLRGPARDVAHAYLEHDAVEQDGKAHGYQDGDERAQNDEHEQPGVQAKQGFHIGVSPAEILR